jgi:hypothetical protein
MDVDGKNDSERWADELAEYLEELGGTATLSELYEYIEEHPKRELKGLWQERVRFELYHHPSNSAIFKGERDLFRQVGAKRSGIWALREQGDLKIVGDPEGFNEDISPNVPPEKRQYIREIFVRNQRLVKKRKKERNYTCERCGYRPPWNTSKGIPYVEAHHLIPLGDNGFDKMKNLIVVCPECHRFLHYAEGRASEIARLAVLRGLPAKDEAIL